MFDFQRPKNILRFSRVYVPCMRVIQCDLGTLLTYPFRLFPKFTFEKGMIFLSFPRYFHEENGYETYGMSEKIPMGDQYTPFPK